VSLWAGFMLQVDPTTFSGLDVPRLRMLMRFPGKGQRCPLPQDARYHGSLCMKAELPQL